jgi:hypothetical protein
MDTSSATLLACGGFFALSFVTIWAFWFVERLREQAPLTCEERPGRAPHVGVLARCGLTTRGERFEFACEKAADFSAALLVFRPSACQ